MQVCKKAANIVEGLLLPTYLLGMYEAIGHPIK